MLSAVDSAVNIALLELQEFEQAHDRFVEGIREAQGIPIILDAVVSRAARGMHFGKGESFGQVK